MDLDCTDVKAEHIKVYAIEINQVYVLHKSALMFYSHIYLKPTPVSLYG